MSDKSVCTGCEKNFNVSTLEKHNGKCGRCAKRDLDPSRKDLDPSRKDLDPSRKDLDSCGKEDEPVEKKELTPPEEKHKSSRTKSLDGYQKAPIPARLRQEVWEKNIGDRFWGNCFVCNIRLHVMEWSCGHIQSEFTGGAMVFENMKVLCKSCNSKMGTENLFEYKARKYPESVKESSIFTRCFCM
jgi:hypothetical protein